jgi:transposase
MRFPSDFSVKREPNVRKGGYVEVRNANGMDPALPTRVTIGRPPDRGRTIMQIARIGLDLAKYVFEVHGVDAHGKTVVRKTLRRHAVSAFFANLPPCLVGM